MADPAPADERGFVAAKESLRGSAKWIANGAAIAVASIFAGTSLAHLGSLDPTDDWWRLLIAVAGMALAVGSVGVLLMRAIKVVSIETVSVTLIAAAETSGLRRDAELSEIAAELSRIHKGLFGANRNTIAEYRTYLGTLTEGTPDYEKAAVVSVLLKEHGSFLLVRDRFEKLVRTLPRIGILAFLGVLPFVWAANPDKAEAARSPPPPSSQIVSTSPAGAAGAKPVSPPPSLPR